MSLILDALNRADQERSVENNAPSLQASNAPIATNERPIKRWIIETVIIVLAIVAGLYFYSKINNNDAVVVEAPPSNTVEPVINPSAQATTQAIEKSDSVNTPPPIEVPSPSIEPNNVPPQKKPVPQVVDKAEISSLYAKEEASIVVAPEKRLNEPSAIPPVKIDNTQSILATIPLLSEHSLSFQRSVPTIEYSIHAYAERGGFVILNGQKYSVGGKLTAQLRVIAILKSSVVLDFKGKQFRLLALNSWINI